MTGVIFRRIAGRIVPIYRRAEKAIDVASIAANKKLMDAAGIRKALQSRSARTVLTNQTSRQYQAAVMRKYGQAIKASGSKFHAQPPNFFFGAKWADIVRGATGQAVAEPIVKNGKIVRTVAGEFATTRRDLATVLHELGHAQQFKEVSKLTRARFARQGKFGGKTLEALHEADAYRRGIKVAKGMNAKKIVFKAGAARMANSYGYIGLQYGAGAGAAAASVGGYALLKKNDDRPRDSGKV